MVLGVEKMGQEKSREGAVGIGQGRGQVWVGDRWYWVGQDGVFVWRDSRCRDRGGRYMQFSREPSDRQILTFVEHLQCMSKLNVFISKDCRILDGIEIRLLYLVQYLRIRVWINNQLQRSMNVSTQGIQLASQWKRSISALSRDMCMYDFA